MRPRLFVVLLVYTREHLHSSLQALDQFCKRVFPKYQCYEVIVDNHETDPTEWGLAQYRTMISGDNRLREFSGWDKGLRWLSSKYGLRDREPVLIVNDTFHRHYGDEYLKRFNRRQVMRELTAGAMVGWVDGYPQKVSLMGLPVQYWVRTSLMLSLYQNFRALTPFAPQFDDDELFTGDETFFHADAPLSDTYKQYLRTWLFSEKSDGEFKEAWHSKQALCDDNRHFLRDKAKCIFCEHILSARAQQLGIPVFDVRNQKRLEIG